MDRATLGSHSLHGNLDNGNDDVCPSQSKMTTIFTAVPRSSQPSTRRGMVKWVSAFGLSNNNVAMVDVDDSSLPAGGLTAQVDWLGLKVGGHLALSLHSSYEPGKLSQWRYAMMTAPSISSWLLILLLLLLLLLLSYTSSSLRTLAMLLFKN